MLIFRLHFPVTIFREYTGEYAANLQEKTHVKLRFQWRCKAFASYIFSEHLFLRHLWVSQKFPDGECAPAVFLPHMLIIIFDKLLLKYSLRCSSKLFLRSWNESSEEVLPRRWEEDCLWRRLPDNVFWNKLHRQSFKG